MIKKIPAHPIAAALFLSLSFSASAKIADWNIQGTNTVRIEDVNVDGDPANSPYPVEGTQAYNEFDLIFSKQFTPFTHVRGQVSGVINDSEYRHPDDGFVPERVSIELQNGDLAVPIKLNAGDYFANISNSTIQRSLKGAQLELQPRAGDSGVRHSILLFTGEDQPFWNDLDFGENLYSGVSWLAAGNWGEVSLNAVNNRFEIPQASQSVRQWVYSVTYNNEFTFGDQLLDVSAELSVFDGDIDNVLFDRSDNGFYFELGGRSLSLEQLDYRFRFEDYGDEFQPRGRVITGNRKSHEAFVGWRYDNGLYLQGRYQSFEDNAEQGDQRDTDLWGLRLSGPLLGSLASDVNGSLHAFRQSVETASNNVDTDITAIDLALSKPLSEDWLLHFSGFLRDENDNTAAMMDQEVQQLGFSVTHNFDWLDMYGSLTAGLMLRDIDAPAADSDETQPTVSLNLYNNQHTLSASYGYFNQDQFSDDLVTQTAGLSYSYRLDNHEFGADAYWYDRDSELFADTETFRLGVSWTYNFNRVAQTASTPRRSQPEPQVPAGQMQPPALQLSSNSGAASSLINGLALGAPLAPQLPKQAQNLGGEAMTIGNTQVYHQQVFSKVAETQRLVLAKDGVGNLARIAVIIDNPGSGSAVRSVYDRVLSELISRYGSPDLAREEGDFSSNLLAGLITGEFQRQLVWYQEGSTIRFGIPRRTDGRLQLEVQESLEAFVPLNDVMRSIALN